MSETNTTAVSASTGHALQISLFVITTAYTVVYFVMMVLDFALREKYTMQNGGTMMGIYVALIGAYAGHKEWQRWTGSDLRSLWGSWFVYAWFSFFLAAFIINNVWPAFELPKDLSKVCLEVLAFLLGSKISKSFYETRKAGEKGEKGEEKYETRSKQIITFIEGNEKITAGDVKKMFGVSKATASRILTEMEESGKIKQQGEKKTAYYVL